MPQANQLAGGSAVPASSGGAGLGATIGMLGGPIGALGGALIGGAFSAYGQSKANKAARKEAKKQRVFQKMMSDTSYQRGMKDMRKAGLNPMLAFSQGGASSPMGAMAPQGNVFQGVDAAINTGVKSAQSHNQNAQLRASVRNVDSQTLANQALAAKYAQETNTSGATEKKINEETMQLGFQNYYGPDTAYGNVPWSGKVKRAMDQAPSFFDKVDRHNYDFIKKTGGNMPPHLQRKYGR